MKSASYLLVVATLAAAMAPTMASPGYAQPIPPVESSAPGISTPAPPPPLNATVPYAVPPSGSSPMEATAPPADAYQETLEDCMGFWDPGTHMSKAEWRQTCQRTLNGTDLTDESTAPAPMPGGERRSRGNPGQ